jgi:hypothetical protein
MMKKCSGHFIKLLFIPFSKTRIPGDFCSVEASPAIKTAWKNRILKDN